MKASNKRLTILSDVEKSALYDLPKFTDTECEEFLILTELEQSLVFSRSDPSHQLYCALQIGYFKAKQAFFNFTWQKVCKENAAFILNHYFNQQNIKRKPIHEYEYYAQRKLIAQLFGYRLWSKQYISLLSNQIKELTKRDITPNFILMEILAFLKKEKIIRPGYTTLQTIISNALHAERKRLAIIIKNALSKDEKEALQNLLIQEKSLSDLAALKQDPKDFKLRMMEAERQKLETIKPLYKIAKTLLPTLHLSKQNVFYYANLINYYTIYDLRKKIKAEQTFLYFLCYIWQRYQQFNDNLSDAFGYHLKQFEDETKEGAKEQLSKYQKKERKEKPIAGRLLQFLVDDDDYHDDTNIGTIRKQAFVMMPKDEIRNLILRFCKKDIIEMDFRWEHIDKLAHRFKNHLRPLVSALDFSSTVEDSPWLAAINWLKNTFSQEKSLNQSPFNECPPGSIPKRLRSFLLELNDDNQPKLKADRYEFWIYRQLRKRLNSGELYLEDTH